MGLYADTDSTSPLPVALFVPVGGPCSTEDKARVMLEMQKATPGKFNVLFLYETDSTFPNAYKTLNPDSEQEAVSSKTLNNVGIVYLSFRDGARLYNHFNATFSASGESSNKNPHFLQPGSESWMFVHSIEGSWAAIEDDEYEDDDSGGYEHWNVGDRPESYPDPDNDNRNGNSSINFYYLFLLLAFVPCYWAGYMCTRNLRFQRNQQGRIIGLEFVRYVSIYFDCIVSTNSVV